MTTSPNDISSFLLDFVRGGGDNTWQYILEMVEDDVDPEPGKSGIVRDSTSLPVNLETTASASDFWYEHGGE